MNAKIEKKYLDAVIKTLDFDFEEGGINRQELECLVFIMALNFRLFTMSNLSYDAYNGIEKGLEDISKMVKKLNPHKQIDTQGMNLFGNEYERIDSAIIADKADSARSTRG
ncbi:MAG: hypothetical protein U9P90_01505 [Patescibacteria group bacterium]|nr:hypothetical protein [Patescibacteria group bacterium]